MEERRFIVGDRIKIRPGSRYYDQALDEIGTIKSMDYLTGDDDDYHSGWIVVEFDNDYKNSYQPIDLCYAVEDITFNIGDKVVITRGSMYWNEEMDEYIGQTATIKGTGRSPETYYTIDLDKGHWHWFPQRGHFVNAPMKGISDKDELLHRAKEMFPVGTKYYCATGGISVFKVTEGSFSLHDANTVYGDLGQGCLYKDGKWAKIFTHKFNVGDWVKAHDVTDYAITTRGWIGEVVNVYDNGEIRVKGKDRHGMIDSWTVHPKFFDLTSKPVESGMQYKYNVGDVVYLTESHLAVKPQQVTITRRAVTPNGKPGYGIERWSGEFPEDKLSWYKSDIKDEWESDCEPDPEPVVNPKFEVDDWVIGLCDEGAPYAITKEGWIGKVTNVYEDGHFDARGDGNDYAGDRTFHDLDPEHFDHYDHDDDDHRPTQEVIDEVSALIERGKEEEFPTTLRMSSPRVKRVSFTRI